MLRRLAHRSRDDIAGRINRLVRGYQSVRPLIELESDLLFDATIYASAMLAFHRFVRHNVRYPDPAKRDLHRELVYLADAVARCR